MMADEYIRRDDAIKIAERYGLANGSVLGRHTGLADCIASEISCLPAADVAPVVHGRWIERKEHFYFQNGCKEWINFYCSECDVPNNSPTDYCPHCGVKMGGADNG